MNSSTIQHSISKDDSSRTSGRSALGCTVLGLLLAFAVTVEAVPVKAKNAATFPPGSTPYDVTFSQWAAAWWHWAYSIPADQNPLFDTTGAFAAVGQSGPVWFLAGTTGNTPTVTRTVQVPVGKSLFFPVIDAIWINIPELGDNPWSPEQREFAFSLISPLVSNAFGLSCEVDGKPVTNLTSYRSRTPAGEEYAIDFPENNIWGIPAGHYDTTVDDGIYLMLPPLSIGQHTLHFTASSAGSIFGDFFLDVTYNITVVVP